MHCYGSLWVRIILSAIFSILIGSFWSFQVLIRHYGFKLVFMSPYKSLCILMDSNQTLWVLMSPFASFCVLFGPYRFLSVFMCPYGSL